MIVEIRSLGEDKIREYTQIMKRQLPAVWSAYLEAFNDNFKGVKFFYPSQLDDLERVQSFHEKLVAEVENNLLAPIGQAMEEYQANLLKYVKTDMAELVKWLWAY